MKKSTRRTMKAVAYKSKVLIKILAYISCWIVSAAFTIGVMFLVAKQIGPMITTDTRVGLFMLGCLFFGTPVMVFMEKGLESIVDKIRT